MPTTRSFLVLLAAGSMLLGVGAVVAPAEPAHAETAPELALFYGDSIMYEARHVITHAFRVTPGWTLRIRSFPGVAPCDWLPYLDSDLKTLHPTVVVLETMGNDFTTCMTRVTGARGSGAYYAKYRSDLYTFYDASTKAGATFVFVRPLPVTNAKFNETLNRLTGIAANQAGRFPGVTVSSLPRDAVTVDGKFSMTKACFPVEKAAGRCHRAGRILVRAPDHVHLCPAGYTTALSYVVGCPVYSSGAVRYGRAVAAAAMAGPS